MTKNTSDAHQFSNFPRAVIATGARAEDVARLLGARKPILMVTDPPYGIELDSEWRDRAGLNGCGPAEASYMKNRTAGHTETTISGDTRADARVTSSPPTQQIQLWHIDKLVLYARNPRKNDAAVDRMCASIREFGFKVPVLARSDGTVVDGHLRIKAARKLGSWPGGDTTAIPVILCDEWTPQQVKAFRLLVNRSVAWADWDEELLALELQELSAADFDLSLT